MKKMFSYLAIGFALALGLMSSSANAAAPGSWVIHDISKKHCFDGTAVNIATDTMKVVLVASTGNFATTAVDFYTGGSGTTALTGELSTANGYTAGGSTVAMSWSGTSTQTAATTANIVWTASGGSIVARAAVMYDNTVASKPIIAHFLLDSTPADVTVTTGNTLTISSGTMFTLAYELMYPNIWSTVAANDEEFHVVPFAKAG